MGSNPKKLSMVVVGSSVGSNPKKLSMVGTGAVGIDDGTCEDSRVTGGDETSPILGMKLGSFEGNALIEGAAVGSTTVCR